MGRAWWPWVKVRCPIERGAKAEMGGTIGGPLVERRDARASRVGMHGRVAHAGRGVEAVKPDGMRK